MRALEQELAEAYKLLRKHKEVKKELKDLRDTFDLRWKADQRAIKMWQAAHPAKKNVWPDHADLVVWLLEQLEKKI